VILIFFRVICLSTTTFITETDPVGEITLTMECAHQILWTAWLIGPDLELCCTKHVKYNTTWTLWWEQTWDCQFLLKRKNRLFWNNYWKCTIICTVIIMYSTNVQYVAWLIGPDLELCCTKHVKYNTTWIGLAGKTFASEIPCNFAPYFPS
jgi:hypothetical protein